MFANKREYNLNGLTHSEYLMVHGRARFSLTSPPIVNNVHFSRLHRIM